MPQQTDSALPTLLSRLSQDGAGLVGRKVRVVGWTLACESNMLLIGYEGHGVLVDISLCVEAQTAGERGVEDAFAFVKERKRKVMVIGVVESLPIDASVPGSLDGTSRRAAGDVDLRCVVRAVLVRCVDGLDLSEWVRALEGV